MTLLKVCVGHEGGKGRFTGIPCIMLYTGKWAEKGSGMAVSMCKYAAYVYPASTPGWSTINSTPCIPLVIRIPRHPDSPLFRRQRSGNIL